MKAFKTFSQCPEDRRPTGVDLSWPWQVEDCLESNQEQLVNKGFSVVTDSEYTAYLAQYQAAIDAWTVLDNRQKMRPVTPRQIRQALFIQGVTAEMVIAALNTLPEPTKTVALIEWEYSIEFQRNRQLVNTAAQMLGWSQTQLDDLWVFASSL